MSGLRLFLLGAPHLERNGTWLQIGNQKALATMAYLSATGQGHRRQSLATLLWPEADPVVARSELDRSLDALQEALGPESLGREALNVDQETVSLARPAGEPGALWLDVAHFKRLLEARGTHGHSLDEVCPECLPLLSEAVDLYRGDFMAGYELPDSPTYEDWRLFEQDVLRREMVRALDHLVRGHSARAEFETAIAYARRRLQLDPLCESAHRQLISLYAWAGDRMAARSQYLACERLVREALDRAPEAATRELDEQIQAGQAPPSLAWPKAPAAGQVADLMTHTTPFVNRERELAEIERLLLGEPGGGYGQPLCRLLTLVGPDGIGKTRLATEIAERVAKAYADGVYVASLAGVEPVSTAVDGLLMAITEALGLPLQDGPDPKARLFDYLRAKNVLLVLDGIENFLPSTELVADIQRTASKVAMVITSREPLGLDGESVWIVGGLGYADGPSPDGPSADASAVKLFLESVHRMAASYPLSESDRRAAVRICRLLEGIPLGLELASAWARAMSLTQISVEIERNLASLSALRDVPPGHRTLRAVLERSWGLLSGDEQRVVAKLSVFRGGFDRLAAQRVSGASPFLLMALGRTALVRPNASLDQTGRYELHELVRQFVANKLHELPTAEQEARDAHCVTYVAFVHEREARLRGVDQRAAGDEIAAEIDNVRAAWRWAVQGHKCGEIERGLEALYLFYYGRGWMQEGAAAFQSAVAALTAPNGVRALEDEYVAGRLLARQARFAHRLGQHEPARDLLRQSRAALDRFERTGHDEGNGPIVPRKERAFGCFALSAVLRALGEAPAARQSLEEGLALYRECGDRTGMAMTLKLLGIVYGSLGELESARQRLQEALALYQEIVDPYGTANTLNDLSIVAARQGKLPEARRLNQACVAIRRQIDDRWGVGTALNNLGYMAYLSQEYVEAIEYLREGLAIQREIGDRYHIANCLSNLGAAAHALGERQEAFEYLYEALGIAYQIGARPLALEASAEIGALLAEGEMQEGEQATELLTFVHDHPQTDKWTTERTEQLLAQLASRLAPETWATAQERGRSRTLEAVVTSLLHQDRAA